MNRHLYGPSHGPPRQKLQLRDAFGFESFSDTTTLRRALPFGISNIADHFMDKVVFKQTWESRIIDDELYLHTNITIYHTKDDTWALRRSLLSDHTMLVCLHLEPKELSSKWSYLYAIPELYRTPHSGGHFTAVSGDVRSCPQCFTDYQMRIQKEGIGRYRRKRWVIRIERWHLLGSCRSPSDNKWNTFVTRGASPQARFRHFGPGTVRHAWNGDPDDTTVEGQFVGVNGHPPWGEEVCLFTAARLLRLG
jgi:hypothetical protein